jgi:hypothetical protein
MRRVFASIIITVCLVVVNQSCSIKLNGASTQGLKTIYVGYFENDAPQVISTLSQNFTEALKQEIRSGTSLSIIQTQQADAVLTGNIIGYSIAPASIQATSNNVAPIASASALTITVSVKYVNNIDKKLSFEQTFSEPGNFTGDIATQQNALIVTITNALTQDIYNKAFANW